MRVLSGSKRNVRRRALYAWKKEQRRLLEERRQQQRLAWYYMGGFLEPHKRGRTINWEGIRRGRPAPEHAQ